MLHNETINATNPNRRAAYELIIDSWKRQCQLYGMS